MIYMYKTAFVRVKGSVHLRSGFNVVMKPNFTKAGPIYLAERTIFPA